MRKLGIVFGNLIVASCLFVVATTVNIHFMNPDERVAQRKPAVPHAHEQAAAGTTAHADREATTGLQVDEARAVSHCDIAAKKQLSVPLSFGADWTRTASVVGDKWVINRTFWAHSVYSGKIRMNYLCRVNTDGSGGGLEMSTGNVRLG